MVVTVKRSALLLAVPLALFALAGCREKGPAEKVGEAIDEAAEETGESLEEAAEDVEDALDK